MPKLKHYDNLGTARFITFSCYQNRNYFSDKNSILIFLKHLKKFRADYVVKVLGYVIMPDHIHLVLYPPDGVKLGVLIGQLKGRCSRELIELRNDISHRANGQPAIWQRRCYDHNCRTLDIVIEKINYCHLNPVKRGLVQTPSDYNWSSYRWYEGYKNIVFEIDGIEL